MRAIAVLTVIGLSLLAPKPAASDFFKPSMKEQIKLGRQVADQIRKKEKVVKETDPRVKLLRSVGERLVAQIPAAERKKSPWEFTFDLIDSKDVNAFALPGGPVFFYSGLFSKFKTEDELAGVLGHEMTHVREEHWATQYADSQKRQLGLTALLIIFKANRTAVDIASIGDTVVFELPYSRKEETRADTGGFAAVVQAGYNPQGMVDVFRMFSEQGGSKPPEFMSTHPDDKKRIKRLEEMVKQSGKTFPAERPISYGPQGRWTGRTK